MTAGRPLYLSHPADLGHATGPGHPERPERLAAVRDALAEDGWAGHEPAEAPEATWERILAVHDSAHVRAVTDAEGARRALDAGDTVAGPGSLEAARRAVGGAGELARAVLAGEAPTGFSAMRPPGHHAGRSSTGGFCLFNSVAIAAQRALDDLGARRVMIIDWDVHHGDGTADIFRDRDDVLYASIHQGGIFPGTGALTDVGARGGEGFTINLPVPAGSRGEAWLSLVEWIVAPAGREFAPDLILVSAGFDAHRSDPLAGCLLECDNFAEMARHVRDLGADVGAPVAAVLEGGYDLDALAQCVPATMRALAGDRPARSAAADFLTERAASQIGHHWRL